MNDSDLIRSHIKSIEAQLRVLEARIQSSSRTRGTRPHYFADLYGRLRGQADSTVEETEGVLYRVTDETQDED